MPGTSSGADGLDGVGIIHGICGVLSQIVPQLLSPTMLGSPGSGWAPPRVGGGTWELFQDFCPFFYFHGNHHGTGFRNILAALHGSSLPPALLIHVTNNGDIKGQLPELLFSHPPALPKLLFPQISRHSGSSDAVSQHPAFPPFDSFP